MFNMDGGECLSTPIMTLNRPQDGCNEINKTLE